MLSEFWKRFFFTFLMGEGFLVVVYLGTLPCIILVIGVQARMFHEIMAINQRERKERQLLRVQDAFFPLLQNSEQSERLVWEYSSPRLMVEALEPLLRYLEG